MDDILRLERFAYLPYGTYGKLFLPDGRVFFTVERPWLNNAVGLSCIKEGLYELVKRESGVVKRSSGGEFTEGWEVAEVDGRTFIMIHPANWPADLEGCIGIGLDFSHMPKNGEYHGVAHSRDAFRLLMEYLAARDSWKLEISILKAV